MDARLSHKQHWVGSIPTLAIWGYISMAEISSDIRAMDVRIILSPHESQALK